MNLEQFEEAKRIVEEINEKKEFLKYFYPKNHIKIYAAEQSGCCTTPYCLGTIDLSKEPELSKIIRSYIENQIKELENKLEEL